MSISLYYHPYSRAAGSIWALEEAGVAYDLNVVDLRSGQQKTPDFVQKNPMGKLPTLLDGDLVVTEAAAIALYLADRYAPGRLAPALDDPRRGTYLRWSLFSPSVVEPAVYTKAAGWNANEFSVGWGNYQAVLDAMHRALADKRFILGDTFSMADVIFGGTLRFMVSTQQIEATPAFAAYIERLNQRPALQRTDERNTAMRQQLGLK
jgi:glutathione S-transferase